MTICELKPGATYEVIQVIQDFHGGVFVIGKQLRFVEKHYLPYDDGYTLVFSERRQGLRDSWREVKMYLQGKDQEEVINATERFLIGIDSET
ncbi:MAG: DUF3601 domain-containing protein [Phycisphaeraceae bacterium]|nr:DUF3601 domain-containing protein [Phycisphaeraceae bacterium]